MKIIPLFDDSKSKLSILSSYAAIEPNLVPNHELTFILARETVMSLQNIIYHDLWCAACVCYVLVSRLLNFVRQKLAKTVRTAWEISLVKHQNFNLNKSA